MTSTMNTIRTTTNTATIRVAIPTMAEAIAQLETCTVGMYSSPFGIAAHCVRGQMGPDSREWGITGAYTSSIRVAAQWLREAVAHQAIKSALLG